MEVACLTERRDKVVRDWHLLHRFELDLMKKQGTDFSKNLRVIEAMYEEARNLGAFPLKDALDGLEVDLKIARVVNFVRDNTHKGSQGTN
jgi:hypothetical protein